MQANRLPEAKDLPGNFSPELKNRALGKAIRAAQALTGHLLGPKSKIERTTLSGQPYRLEAPASTLPYVTARDGRQLPFRMLDEQTLVPELTDLDEFTIVYTTGLVDGEVPAVMKQLVLLLGSWFLLKERATRDEIMVTARIARKYK